MRRVVDWASALGLEYTRTRSSLAAGGLAYFVALSLAPAALAFGTLAGLVLDPADIRSVLERLAERSPEAMGDLKPIVEALALTVERASTTAFSITAVVSTVIAVYAASKVVFGLRLAMNTIAGVTETRSGLIERGIATLVTLAGMVIGVAVVLLLTLVPKVLEWLGLQSALTVTGNWLLEWAAAMALVFVGARWILQHAPNRAQRVPWTSPGPPVATLGILAATIGVGLYVRFSASLSVTVLLFGTAVVILLWLYLCFVALLWGAIVEADSRRRRDVRTRTIAGDQPPVP